MKTTIRTEVEIDLSIETAAQWFAGLDDDSQAKFFVEVARIASTWDSGYAGTQWWYLGGHLRNCKCSTDEARSMIREIADGIEHNKHGAEAAA